MKNKKETDIKKYLLPYQAILKLTDMEELNDIAPLIPDPRSTEEFAWKGLDYSCSFPTLPLKNIGNEPQSRDFVKNNCGGGQVGTTVTYTIPANRYFGFNVAEANLYAIQDITQNGQIYANANGTCVASPYGWRPKTSTAYCLQDNVPTTQEIVVRWNELVSTLVVEVYSMTGTGQLQLIETFNKNSMPASITEKKFVYNYGVNCVLAISASSVSSANFVNVTAMNLARSFSEKGSIVIPANEIRTNGIGETVIVTTSSTAI